MKNRIIVTPHTYQYKKPYETPHGESLTVQGDSFTIPELYARNSSGIKTKPKPEYYSENPSIEDIDMEKTQRLDLIERHELLEQTKLEIARIKKATEQAQHTPQQTRSSANTTEAAGGQVVNEVVEEPATIQPNK